MRNVFSQVKRDINYGPRVFLMPSISLFPVLAAAAVLAPALLSAASYSITGVVSQTVGSTAEIPGSGTKDNTASWSAGTVGRFLVTDTLGNQYGLQVDASNPTGTLAAGTDSLMVARTVNSQTLTDTGTLSVYVNPGASATADGAWSLNLKFSFFDTTFTVPAPVDLLLTSLDIDYNQKYSTENADFQSNNLYANTTLTSSVAGGYTTFTAAGDSTYNNPTHAVSSKGNSQSSFDVKIAHDAVALYMFEFRDPSQIVPEAGTSTALAFGVAGLLLRRRRNG
jgi:hypothetical protein